VTIATFMPGRLRTLADVHQQVKHDMYQYKTLRTWLRDEEAAYSLNLAILSNKAERCTAPRPALPAPGPALTKAARLARTVVLCRQSSMLFRDTLGQGARVLWAVLVRSTDTRQDTGYQVLLSPDDSR
jgi:hypothetical protein